MNSFQRVSVGNVTDILEGVTFQALKAKSKSCKKWRYSLSEPLEYSANHWYQKSQSELQEQMFVIENLSAHFRNTLNIFSRLISFLVLPLPWRLIVRSKANTSTAMVGYVKAFVDTLRISHLWRNCEYSLYQSWPTCELLLPPTRLLKKKKKVFFGLSASQKSVIFTSSYQSAKSKQSLFETLLSLTCSHILILPFPP